jgi:uncharacterized protein
VRHGWVRGILLVMTGEQHIDYETLAQNAMRGIVRTVLIHVAKSQKLPGEHHFYIAFNTVAPGVVISRRLREKYPEEMTIVLQHRFWNLIVKEERFEVNLTFDGIEERLVVPFAAIRVFFDPSVPYGLQFEGSDLASDAASELDLEGADTREAGPALEGRPTREADAPEGPPTQGGLAKKVRTPRKPRAGKRDLAGEGAGKPAPVPALGPPAEAGSPRQGVRPRLVASKREQPSPANDTKVVQLDAFRKK